MRAEIQADDPAVITRRATLREPRCAVTVADVATSLGWLRVWSVSRPFDRGVTSNHTNYIWHDSDDTVSDVVLVVNVCQRLSVVEPSRSLVRVCGTLCHSMSLYSDTSLHVLPNRFQYLGYLNKT